MNISTLAVLNLPQWPTSVEDDHICYLQYSLQKRWMVRLYTFLLSFIQRLFSNLSVTEKMRQLSSYIYLTAFSFLSMNFCRFTSTFQYVGLLWWILLSSSTTISCLRTSMLLQYVVSIAVIFRSIWIINTIATAISYSWHRNMFEKSRKREITAFICYRLTNQNWALLGRTV